jgi:hypothetical protein
MSIIVIKGPIRRLFGSEFYSSLKIEKARLSFIQLVDEAGVVVSVSSIGLEGRVKM